MKHFLLLLFLFSTQLNAAKDNSATRKKLEMTRDSYALYILLNHVFWAAESTTTQFLPHNQSERVRKVLGKEITGDCFGQSFGSRIEFYLHSYTYSMQIDHGFIRLSAKKAITAAIQKAQHSQKTPEEITVEAAKTSFYRIAPQIAELINLINRYIPLSTFEYFDVSTDELLTSMRKFQTDSRVPYCEEFYKEALSAISNGFFTQNLTLNTARSDMFKWHTFLVLRKSTLFSPLPTDMKIIIFDYLGDYGYLKKSGLLENLEHIRKMEDKSSSSS